MARLHEYQGKTVLAHAGIATPAGGPATSAAEAGAIAAKLARPVVVKIQAFATGRAAMGGVAFANTPQEAEAAAARMLAMTIGQFPITHVLVEEKLAIAIELFISVAIDERDRRPVMLLSRSGGSGIEERAGAVRRVACHVARGPDPQQLAAAIAALNLDVGATRKVSECSAKVFRVARTIEARSVEINPLVICADGRLVAADCRIAVDDYAVFRHPELGIEIARELDHPPTRLERIAYDIEQADHRGTFYFAQMNAKAPPSSKGLIGFHGAGGGGSMMSMDAITSEGFTVANFCDTSGNPSPAKVYRAARIILSQPGIIGYFGSGSGVANQEQYWSAYGLAKAFWEMNLSIPAVIRLGGNTEDRAVDILQSGCRGLPAKVECYKKTDTPAQIAARFAALVSEHQRTHGAESAWVPCPPRRPAFVGTPSARAAEIKGGCVWIDPAAWRTNAAAISARSGELLRDSGGAPTWTITPAELLAKDSEMIVCEVECRRDGIEGIFVELEIPGLDQPGPKAQLQAAGGGSAR